MKAERLTGSDRPVPLGFTFSFPCTQKGLASATLVTWTKGFDCDGVVGEDVVKLLQDAINRRGVSIFFSIQYLQEISIYIKKKIGY